MELFCLFFKKKKENPRGWNAIKPQIRDAHGILYILFRSGMSKHSPYGPQSIWVIYSIECNLVEQKDCGRWGLGCDMLDLDIQICITNMQLLIFFIFLLGFARLVSSTWCEIMISYEKHHHIPGVLPWKTFCVVAKCQNQT